MESEVIFVIELLTFSATAVGPFLLDLHAEGTLSFWFYTKPNHKSKQIYSPLIYCIDYFLSYIWW